MKNMFLILSIFLFITGCSEEEAKQQEDPIYGTWKLIETYGSDGGNNPQWVSITDGYEYTFNDDGNIISDRFTCNGSYTLLSSNQVTINFDCVDSQFNLMYTYSFENQNLILTPDLLNCDEGCGEKYEKIE